MSRPEFYSRRKDLQLPCWKCPDRMPPCQDTCQKPEYLEALELREKLAASKQRNHEVADYERKTKLRRAKGK